MRKSVLAVLILVSSGGVALARMDAGDQDKGSMKAAFDKMCAAKPQPADKDNTYVDTLTKSLLLGDDQKKKLLDYRDTQAKAIDDARSKVCNEKPDLTSFQASLDFRQKMLETQLDTLKSVNPKLIDFYNSLNSEQKAKFDGMRQNMASQSARGRR